MSKVGGSAHASLGGQGTSLKPQKSSVNEMMTSLNDRQKEMLLFALQDASIFIME